MKIPEKLVAIEAKPFEAHLSITAAETNMCRRIHGLDFYS